MNITYLRFNTLDECSFEEIDKSSFIALLFDQFFLVLFVSLISILNLAFRLIKHLLKFVILFRLSYMTDECIDLIERTVEEFISLVLQGTGQDLRKTIGRIGREYDQ